MAFDRDIIFIDNETKLNAENMNNFMEGINESLDYSGEIDEKVENVYTKLDNGEIHTKLLEESKSMNIFVYSDGTIEIDATEPSKTGLMRVYLSAYETTVDLSVYEPYWYTAPSGEVVQAIYINNSVEKVTIVKGTEKVEMCSYVHFTEFSYQLYYNLMQEAKTSSVGNERLSDGCISKEKLDNDLNNLITPPLPWAGLKVSVLGDSTSAYKGYIPSGNAAYYTGSNSGVSSYKEMWWNILCEKLGAERCVINAWSGSAICSGITSATPCSDTSRCQNLHTDETEPDVILISAGNNDCGNSVPLGDWDGSTELDITDTSTFRSAYANMLAKIHECYPKALVICLSPTFTMRLTAEKYDTGRNSLGLTYADYENAVKEIANLMQCVYVDQNNFGFTRYNYYGNFCVDSSTKPMHPNALGHKIIGTTLADICVHVAKGYIEWLKTDPVIYVPEDENEILTYNLTGADFVQGSIAGQSTGNLPPASSGYIKSNSLICSMVGLTLPVTGGTTVRVEVTAVDSSVELEVALQAINQDAADGFGTSEIGFVKADVYGGGELPTEGAYSKTSGWLASGTEWTIPDAGVCLFVTVHRKDQTAITPEEIASVTITEVN